MVFGLGPPKILSAMPVVTPSRTPRISATATAASATIFLTRLSMRLLGCQRGHDAEGPAGGQAPTRPRRRQGAGRALDRPLRRSAESRAVAFPRGAGSAARAACDGR